MTALATTQAASPAEVWVFVAVLVLALAVGIGLRVRQRREHTMTARRITYTHVPAGLAWSCTCGESGVDGWDRYAMRAARERQCRGGGA